MTKDELKDQLDILEVELREIVIDGVLETSINKDANEQLHRYLILRRLLHNLSTLKRDLTAYAESLHVMSLKYNNTSERLEEDPYVKNLELNFPWLKEKNEHDEEIHKINEFVFIRDNILMPNGNDLHSIWSFREIVEKWVKHARKKKYVKDSPGIKAFFYRLFNPDYAYVKKSLYVIALLDILGEEKGQELVRAWKHGCQDAKERLMDALGPLGLLPAASKTVTEEITLRDCISVTRAGDYLDQISSRNHKKRDDLIKEIGSLQDQLGKDD